MPSAARQEDLLPQGRLSPADCRFGKPGSLVELWQLFPGPNPVISRENLANGGWCFYTIPEDNFHKHSECFPL